MFITSLLALVIGFMAWGAFLTVKLIGKNRVPVTPELAARVLLLASVLNGSLLYVYLTADAGAARAALLPAMGLLSFGVVRTTLKIGRPRKPLTSVVALVDVALDLIAVTGLIYFGFVS